MKPLPNTLLEQKTILINGLSKLKSDISKMPDSNLKDKANILKAKSFIDKYNECLNAVSKLINEGNEGFVCDYDLDLNVFFEDFLSSSSSLMYSIRQRIELYLKREFIAEFGADLDVICVNLDASDSYHKDKIKSTLNSMIKGKEVSIKTINGLKLYFPYTKKLEDERRLKENKTPSYIQQSLF